MKFLKQTLIFVHRWLGVVLCLLFLLWFPSGFVMMYWDYPSIKPADRFAHLAPIDPSSLKFSPAEAAASAQIDAPGAVRLTTFAGRPIYRFGGRGDATVVYADTGEEQVEISQNDVAKIAQMWTGQSPKDAKVEAVERSDQWTLQNRVRDLQPLWKFSWPDGQQLYVSEGIGDVIQYTTRASRLAAYFGAIPHWLYFPPLRRNGPLWNRVVIWSSGIATFAALVGMIIGVWMYSPSRRYKYAGAPSTIPYAGWWKRWHMIIGLLAGAGAVTWAFSGLLSMEPFPQRDDSDEARGAERVLQALRGRAPLERFAAKTPQAALAQLRGLRVKELEWVSIAGEPAYFATIAPGDTRIVPVEGAPVAMLDGKALVEIVTDALKRPAARVSLMAHYDRYYLDRHHVAPLPVVLVELHDAAASRYYLDPKSARIVGGYGATNFLDRWLYHGLHSMNFPWLYDYRPAWDIVVIAFMLSGTALAVTSLVLAWQVLGRKLRLISA
jgi:PepSY-associated TM region